MTFRLTSMTAIFGCAIAAAATANAAEWSGFYLGAQAGYNDGDGNIGEIRVPDSVLVNEFAYDYGGGAAGVFAGYNWQSGPWVYGVEGDIEFSDTSGEAIVFLGNAMTKDIDWQGALRVRVGYSDGAALFYAAAGAAVAHADVATYDFGVSESVHGDETVWGHTLGGGVEFAFSNHWSGRIEYRWIDLDDAAAQGPIFGSTFRYEHDNAFSAVRAGVSYHLN